MEKGTEVSREAAESRFLEFKQIQNELRSHISKASAERDKRWYDYILRCPRNLRAKRFWAHARKSERAPRKEVKIKDEDGNEVKSSQMKNHLTAVLKQLLGATEVAKSQCDRKKMNAPIEQFSITQADVQKAMERVSTHRAARPDGIPGKMIKEVGETGSEYLAQVFQDVIEGNNDIPNSWSEGRVTLIEKPNSVKGILQTYRPLTISDITYRIFARILNKKIQEWMTSIGILGEMQHGYRGGMRGDDSLFILTGTIEIARGLLATFLDCTKAYEKVCKTKLWSILESLGLHENRVKFLRISYEDTTVYLKTGELNSRAVTTHCGLRQGCALSPTLFLLYISGLAKRLLFSGK